jgi:predicted O-linked N-acetylglucosamine transferase (SPINDLY family)
MGSPDLEQYRYDAALAIARQQRGRGQAEAAIEAYRRACAIATARIEAPRELGEMLHGAGRLEQARDILAAGLTLAPDDYGLNFALGNTLSALGDVAGAERHYRAAIAAQPTSAIAHNNLGYMLRLRGDADSAIIAFNEAILQSPGLTLAHCNLADLYLSLGRHEEAADAARRGVALDPDSSTARFLRARALGEGERIAESLQAFADGMQRFASEPRFASFLAGTYYRIGAVAEALDYYQRALALQPGDAATQSNILLLLNYSRRDAEAVAEDHRAWGRTVEREAAVARPPLPSVAGRTIRVGYVSADFYHHPVGQLIAPVIASHDQAAFSVFCYHNNAKHDDLTQRVAASGVAWRQIERMSDAAVARQVAADGIDLLVDLAGHTGGNRLGLFARRAAPVQATWLGYPNTTGLRAMDYRITDAVADPPGMTERFHTETLVRLPGCFLCAAPPSVELAPSPPPAARSGRFTFGCFNNLAKISPETIALWAHILAAAPQAALFLKAAPLADPAIRARWTEAFARHGVRPERLRLSGRMGYAQHLAAYGEVDLALDPFPYNGTATSLEGLWMGVPFVTLEGDRHAARVGASVLRTLDLASMIARDVDAYAAIAAGLAQRIDVLAALRAGMRKRMLASGLGDPARFTRGLEAAYRAMVTTPPGGPVGASGR